MTSDDIVVEDPATGRWAYCTGRDPGNLPRYSAAVYDTRKAALEQYRLDSTPRTHTATPEPETDEPSAGDYLAHHMAIRIRQGGVCRVDVDTSPDLDRVGADLLDDLTRSYRRTALACWLIDTGILQPAGDDTYTITGLPRP